MPETALDRTTLSMYVTERFITSLKDVFYAISLSIHIKKNSTGVNKKNKSTEFVIIRSGGILFGGT